jgi:hypothetical protein
MGLGLFASVKSFVLSPLTLTYPIDIMRRQIQARLQWVIFQTLPCPTDQGWSLGNTPFDDLPFTLVSSSRYHVTMPARPRARLSTLLGTAFPLTETTFSWYGRVKRLIRNWRTRRRLPERTYEEALKQSVEARYGELVLMYQGSDDPNFQTHEQLKKEAIRQALEECRIDPRGSDVNIQAWAENILDQNASGGRRNWNELLEESNSSQGEEQTHAGGFSDPVPLDALLEPAQNHSPSSPPTPAPVLSRAVSLSQVPAASTTPPVVHPRPVRRPTEVDDTYSSSSDDSSDSWEPIQTAIRGPTAALSERVSLLSTAPAYTFAYLSSSFITSVVMLPFDIYLTRRLAHDFLSTTNGLSQATIPLLSDLWPALPTRAIFSVSTVKLLGTVLLTFGIEAVAKSITWTLCTRACVSLGQSQFLWGTRLRPGGRDGW